MPSFAFESGSLLPASLGHPSTSPLTPDIRRALRDYLLDVVEADLFPVEWSEDEDPVLTAMDRAGQVVTAVVTDRLDGPRLMAALARAGQATATPWLTIAGRYRSGVGGFRRDWNAFRESRPPGAVPGPQLYLVAGEVTREVVEATRVLHGVQVFAVDARESATGQRLLDVTAVQPAMVRVLQGDVVHEIEPAISGDLVAAPGEPVGAADAREMVAAATPVDEVAVPAPVGEVAAPAPVGTVGEPAPVGDTDLSVPEVAVPVAATSEVAVPVAAAPEAAVPVAATSEVAVPVAAAPETAVQVAATSEVAGSAAVPIAAPAVLPSDREPAAADPHLQAIAELVGAPMPIELRHQGTVQHAVLTAEGSLQLGERTVATIERATEMLGGEPRHAWSSWHVAGFPMAEARAEAAGGQVPVRAARAGRRRG